VSGSAVGRSSLADLYPRIAKSRRGVGKPANLSDYETIRSTLTWRAARAQLAGLPEGRRLNITHEVVDRRARGSRGDRHALRWIGRKGGRRNITYRELKTATESLHCIPLPFY
jgi:acetyl-CoA synthetase